ncbi:MAG: hypothetical protein AAF617_13235, partial [Bacteroidota bacterium]
QFVFITDKNSNSVKYKFKVINNKYAVKRMKKLFKNCNQIAALAKEKKKVLKKKTVMDFVKMIDGCL